MENLLEAWSEFLRGKRNKKDVRTFSFQLMDSILSLHNELSNFTYRHGGYQAFKINDPKPRDIHKAPVRDRLLHHTIYRILYPFFEKTFIADSYSCRLEKGTHKAVNRLRQYCFKVSKNNNRICWVLKCDIKKFFANIDHSVLVDILREYISDERIVWLLENVINSFSSEKPGAGIPLGNLTSQLFANVYLNKLDQFAKHKLKAEFYIRYADDFVLLSENRERLEEKISPIRKFRQGIDFLGYVVLPHYTALRTKTKKRMLKKIRQKKLDLINGKIFQDSFKQSVQSYLGVLKHCRGYKIRKRILKMFFLEI